MLNESDELYGEVEHMKQLQEACRYQRERYMDGGPKIGPQALRAMRRRQGNLWVVLILMMMKEMRKMRTKTFNTSMPRPTPTDGGRAF
jgi:hypothetical protein